MMQESREDGAAPPSRLRDAVTAFGTDAISFLALESGMRVWVDRPEPEGTGACVAYVDTGSGWVAVGSPLAERAERTRAAERFVGAARASGRRACFFAADFGGAFFAKLLLGERPLYRPAKWLAESTRHRGLREQLRRARAKGVSIRRVDATELAPGAPLRREVDRLAEEWLASRRIEPMAFLLAVEPYQEPDLHRYFVAERQGRLLGFFSAVPFQRERGWLVEDAFRRRAAPNGATELLLHALIEDVAGADRVTLGLAPLTGAVVWPLRAARWLTRPLFDFAGLRRFRERMHPQSWEEVFLVFPRSDQMVLHLIEVLRAFAGGSLLRFGLRSLVRHPSGPPWALALPLIPWTAALGFMTAAGSTASLGFSRAALALFTAFDAAVVIILLRAAQRPTARRIAAAALLAGLDATVSVAHLAAVGGGGSPSTLAMRLIATAAPVIATVALGRAAMQSRRQNAGTMRDWGSPSGSPSAKKSL